MAEKRRCRTARPFAYICFPSHACRRSPGREAYSQRLGGYGTRRGPFRFPYLFFSSIRVGYLINSRKAITPPQRHGRSTIRVFLSLFISSYPRSPLVGSVAVCALAAPDSAPDGGPSEAAAAAAALSSLVSAAAPTPLVRGGDGEGEDIPFRSS